MADISFDFRDVESDPSYQASGLSKRMLAHRLWAEGYTPKEEGALEKYARMVHEAENRVTGKIPDPQITYAENVTNMFAQGVGMIGSDLLRGVGIVGNLATNMARDLVTDGVSWTEADDNAIYEFGESLDAWMESTFPGDPERQDDFFATVLPQAFGSMLGFLIPVGGAAKGMGLAARSTSMMNKTGMRVATDLKDARYGLFGKFGKYKASDVKLIAYGGKEITDKGSPIVRAAATKIQKDWAKYAHLIAGAGVGSAVGAGSQHREALLNNARHNASAAAFYGALVGVTEITPVARMFNRATAPQKAWAWKMIMGGIEEGLQEAGSEIGYNAVAKGLYDSEREFFDGIATSGGAGGVVGAVLGLGSGLLDGRRARHRRYHRSLGSKSEVRIIANQADAHFDFSATVHEGIANENNKKAPQTQLEKEAVRYYREEQAANPKAGDDAAMYRAGIRYAEDRNILLLKPEDLSVLNEHLITLTNGDVQTINPSAIGNYNVSGQTVLASHEAWTDPELKKLVEKYPQITQIFPDLETLFKDKAGNLSAAHNTSAQNAAVAEARKVRGLNQLSLETFMHGVVIVETSAEIKARGEDPTTRILVEKDNPWTGQYYEEGVEKRLTRVNGRNNSGNRIHGVAGETVAVYEEIWEVLLKRIADPNDKRVAGNQEFSDSLFGSVHDWLRTYTRALETIIKNDDNKQSASTVKAAVALQKRIDSALKVPRNKLIEGDNTAKLEVLSDAIVFSALGYTHNNFGNEYSRLLQSFSRAGDGKVASSGFIAWKHLQNIKNIGGLIDHMKTDPQFDTTPIYVDQIDVPTGVEIGSVDIEPSEIQSTTIPDPHRPGRKRKQTSKRGEPSVQGVPEAAYQPKRKAPTPKKKKENKTPIVTPEAPASKPQEPFDLKGVTEMLDSPNLQATPAVRRLKSLVKEFEARGLTTKKRAELDELLKRVRKEIENTSPTSVPDKKPKAAIKKPEESTLPYDQIVPSISTRRAAIEDQISEIEHEIWEVNSGFKNTTPRTVALTNRLEAQVAKLKKELEELDNKSKAEAKKVKDDWEAKHGPIEKFGTSKAKAKKPQVDPAIVENLKDPHKDPKAIKAREEIQKLQDRVNTLSNLVALGKKHPLSMPDDDADLAFAKEALYAAQAKYKRDFPDPSSTVQVEPIPEKDKSSLPSIDDQVESTKDEAGTPELGEDVPATKPLTDTDLDVTPYFERTIPEKEAGTDVADQSEEDPGTLNSQAVRATAQAADIGVTQEGIAVRVNMASGPGERRAAANRVETHVSTRGDKRLDDIAGTPEQLIEAAIKGKRVSKQPGGGTGPNVRPIIVYPIDSSNSEQHPVGVAAGVPRDELMFVGARASLSGRIFRSEFDALPLIARSSPATFLPSMIAEAVEGKDVKFKLPFKPEGWKKDIQRSWIGVPKSKVRFTAKELGVDPDLVDNRSGTDVKEEFQYRAHKDDPGQALAGNYKQMWDTWADTGLVQYLRSQSDEYQFNVKDKKGDLLPGDFGTGAAFDAEIADLYKRANLGPGSRDAVYRRDINETTGSVNTQLLKPQRDYWIQIRADDPGAGQMAESFAKAGLIPPNVLFYKDFEELVIKAGGARSGDGSMDSKYQRHSGGEIPSWNATPKWDSHSQAWTTKSFGHGISADSWEHDYGNPWQISDGRPFSIREDVWGIELWAKRNSLFGKEKAKQWATNDAAIIYEAWLNGRKRVRLTDGEIYDIENAALRVNIRTPKKQTDESGRTITAKPSHKGWYIEKLQDKRLWILNQIHHEALRGRELEPKGIEWPNSHSKLAVMQDKFVHAKMRQQINARVDEFFDNEGQPTRLDPSQLEVKSGVVEITKKGGGIKGAAIGWGYTNEAGMDIAFGVIPDQNHTPDGMITGFWQIRRHNGDRHHFEVPKEWFRNIARSGSQNFTKEQKDKLAAELEVVQRSVLNKILNEVVDDVAWHDGLIAGVGLSLTRRERVEPSQLVKRWKEVTTNIDKEVKSKKITEEEGLARKEKAKRFFEEEKRSRQFTEESGAMGTVVKETSGLEWLPSELRGLGKELNEIERRRYLEQELTDRQIEVLKTLREYSFDADEETGELSINLNSASHVDPLYERQENIGAAYNFTIKMTADARSNAIILDSISGSAIHLGEINMGFLPLSSLQSDGSVSHPYLTDIRGSNETAPHQYTVSKGGAKVVSMIYPTLLYQKIDEDTGAPEYIKSGQLKLDRGEPAMFGSPAEDVAIVDEDLPPLEAVKLVQRRKPLDADPEVVRRQFLEQSKSLTPDERKRGLERVSLDKFSQEWSIRKKNEQMAVRIHFQSAPDKTSRIHADNFMQALGWESQLIGLEARLKDSEESEAQIEKILEETRKEYYDKFASGMGYDNWQEFSRSTDPLIRSFFGEGVLLVHYDVLTKPSDDALTAIQDLRKPTRAGLNEREIQEEYHLDRSNFQNQERRVDIPNEAAGSGGYWDSSIRQEIHGSEMRMKDLLEQMLRLPANRTVPELRALSIQLNEAAAEELMDTWQVLNSFTHVERALLLNYLGGRFSFYDEVVSDKFLLANSKDHIDLLQAHIDKQILDANWHLSKRYPDAEKIAGKYFPPTDEDERRERILDIYREATKEPQEELELWSHIRKWPTAMWGKEAKRLDKHIAKLEKKVGEGNKDFMASELPKKVAKISKVLSMMEVAMNQKISGKKKRIEWRKFWFDFMGINGNEHEMNDGIVPPKARLEKIENAKDVEGAHNFDVFIKHVSDIIRDPSGGTGKLSESAEAYFTNNPEARMLYEEISAEAQRQGFDVSAGAQMIVSPTDPLVRYEADFESFVRTYAHKWEVHPDRLRGWAFNHYELHQADPMKDTTFGDDVAFLYYSPAESSPSIYEAVRGQGGYWDVVKIDSHGKRTVENSSMHPAELKMRSDGKVIQSLLTVQDISVGKEINVLNMSAEELFEFYDNTTGLPERRGDLEAAIKRATVLNTNLARPQNVMPVDSVTLSPMFTGSFLVDEINAAKIALKVEGEIEPDVEGEGDFSDIESAIRKPIHSVNIQKQRQDIPEGTDRVITIKRNLRDVTGHLTPENAHKDHYVYTFSTRKWFKIEKGTYVPSAEPAIIGNTYINYSGPAVDPVAVARENERALALPLSFHGKTTKPMLVKMIRQAKFRKRPEAREPAKPVEDSTAEWGTSVSLAPPPKDNRQSNGKLSDSVPTSTGLVEAPAVPMQQGDVAVVDFGPSAVHLIGPHSKNRILRQLSPDNDFAVRYKGKNYKNLSKAITDILNAERSPETTGRRSTWNSLLMNGLSKTQENLLTELMLHRFIQNPSTIQPLLEDGGFKTILQSAAPLRYDLSPDGGYVRSIIRALSIIEERMDDVSIKDFDRGKLDVKRIARMSSNPSGYIELHPEQDEVHTWIPGDFYDAAILGPQTQMSTSEMVRLREVRGFPAATISSKAKSKPDVETVQRFSVSLVRENPNKIYLFGDNIIGKGYKGQAVIRDEGNAYGIPTKKLPSGTNESYFTDTELEQNKEVIDKAIARIPKGQTIVLPSAGLGTGAAKLSEKAPKTFSYLNDKLKQLQTARSNEAEEYQLHGTRFIITSGKNQNVSAQLSEDKASIVIDEEILKKEFEARVFKGNEDPEYTFSEELKSREFNKASWRDFVIKRQTLFATLKQEEPDAEYNITVNDAALDMQRREKDLKKRRNKAKRILGKYKLFSGGAKGADTIWGVIAKQFGLSKIHHIYWSEESKNRPPEANITVAELQMGEFNEEEAGKAVANAAHAMYGGSKGKKFKSPLLLRNYYQVLNADSVFAVAPMGQVGDVFSPDVGKESGQRKLLKQGPQGGTAYAVEMAIQMDKPVWLYDTISDSWKLYERNSTTGEGEWITSNAAPLLTENFAGIGSREVEVGSRAADAIKDVFEQTLDQLTGETSSMNSQALQYSNGSSEAKDSLSMGRQAESVDELLRQNFSIKGIAKFQNGLLVRGWKKLVKESSKLQGEDVEKNWRMITRFVERTGDIEPGTGKELTMTAKEVHDYVSKRDYLLDVAMQLRTKYPEVLGNINDLWTQIHQNGADSGITYIKTLNDYMTHFYKTVPEDPSAIESWARQRMQNMSRNSKERSMPTLVAAQQMGYKPLTFNAADIFLKYSNYNARILANKATQMGLNEMTDETGNKVIYHRKSGEQVGPVLPRPGSDFTRKWWHKNQPSRHYVQMDAPYISRDGLWVHPDYADVVERVTYSPLEDRWLNGMENLNAVMKKHWLALSFFHPLALFESGISTVGVVNWAFPRLPDSDGRMAISWKHMFRPLMAVNEWVATNPEMLRDPLDAGLQIGGPADVQLDAYKRMVQWADDLTERMPGVNHMIKGWSKVNETWDKALWEHTHTGWKLYAYFDVKAKVMQKHGHEISWQDAAPEVAKHINDAFGGINWDLERWLSPTQLRGLKNLLLAPDWTSANIRVAFRPLFSKNFPSYLTGQWATYWKRMIFVQLTVGMVFQKAIKELYAPDDEDVEDNSLNNPGKYKFGYVNVTPLIRSLPIIRKLAGVNDEEHERGAHIYTHGGKQWREVIRMFMDPPQYLGSKLTPAIQTVWEQLSDHSVTGWKAKWARDPFWDSVPDRTVAIANKFLPFSLQGLANADEAFSHGGSFALATPINREITEGAARYMFNERLKYYLKDESAITDSLPKLGVDLIDAMLRNGLGEIEIRRAMSGSEVISETYDEFFKAWEKGDAENMDKWAVILLKLDKDMKDITRAAKMRGLINEETHDYLQYP